MKLLSIFSLAFLFSISASAAGNVSAGQIHCQMSNWIVEKKGDDTTITIVRAGGFTEPFSVSELGSEQNFEIKNTSLPLTATVTVGYGITADDVSVGVKIVDARDGKSVGTFGHLVPANPVLSSNLVDFGLNEKLPDGRTLSAVRIICMLSK